MGAHRVDAFAGSGKTSIAIALMLALKKLRILYVVYNNANAKEVVDKLKDMGIFHVDVK